MKTNFDEKVSENLIHHTMTEVLDILLIDRTTSTKKRLKILFGEMITTFILEPISTLHLVK
ncbi:hypothetical protein [Staphylococcus sp. GDY8P57P]|uniref:hypothetical protein n=1 Tax=Staphylococcus sp. GDY8P57P TaxID=2804128 RepID=UPI001AEBEA69|nr:hypothetical protein [Staphylococcus sp. GDY8P57P]